MIVVGICGASGSGKSTLARNVARQLEGVPTLILGQDCYYKDHSDLPFEQRQHVNYDEPQAFDYDELAADIRLLAAGKPIAQKGYDYAQHVRADSGAPIPAPQVLLLEGIHVFYNRPLAEMMNLKVYVQVDADICLLRRIKRDIQKRGRSIESISEQYLATVKPMYEKYIAKYVDVADFSVMRGGKNHQAVQAIAGFIRGQLAL